MNGEIPEGEENDLTLLSKMSDEKRSEAGLVTRENGFRRCEIMMFAQDISTIQG
jgi:hypothetical protein